MCTRGKADNDGWCTGDSLCPELGPLDFHDEEGNVVWNKGGHELTDGEPNEAEHTHDHNNCSGTHSAH